MNATQQIQKSLPKRGRLVVFQCTGAACDSPIFYNGKKLGRKHLFSFSSYGMVPPNYKEFRELSSYGMCGSAGETDDVKVVAKAISLLNKKRRVGLCEGFVIDQLLLSGFKVERVDAGFR